MSSIKPLISELFPQLALDPDLMKEFDNKISIRTFKKGHFMVDYGDYITHIPLVLEGVMKVMRENDDEKEVLLYFLEGGNTCAASFSCCMIKKRSEIKVIAETDCKTAFIPLETVNLWMSKYESWRNFVFSMFEQRLTALIDTIDLLAFSSLDDQLLDYLHNRATHTDDGVIQVSHASIANDLTVSREAISRLLKKMEDQKMVKLGRNKITMLV